MTTTAPPLPWLRVAIGTRKGQKKEKVWNKIALFRSKIRAHKMYTRLRDYELQHYAKPEERLRAAEADARSLFVAAMDMIYAVENGLTHSEELDKLRNATVSHTHVAMGSTTSGEAR